MPIRLGDDLDDFCIKCKRVTNHSIVSLLNDEPAKVRCRTCYNDHDFRRCEVPPTKKELKKAAMDALAATAGIVAVDPDADPAIEADAEIDEETDEVTGEVTEDAANVDIAEESAVVEEAPKAKRGRKPKV